MRFFIFFTSLLLLITVSCSSKKVKNEVKNEVASAPQLKNDSELYSLENNMLSDDKHLSQDQRSKLQTLIQKMKNQNIAIDNEIMKTKVVLFQSLIAKNKSKVKLNVLESQLIKLNRKKVRYSLSAYREARNIVGKSDVPLEKTLKMIDNRTIYDF